MASALIIDPRYSEDYRKALSGKFPEIELRAYPDEARIGDEIERAEVLVGLSSSFSDRLVSSAKRLRWIQALTTGTDAIEKLRTLPKDVIITSSRGVHGPQVAEMAVMMMMARARDLPRILRNQREARWERFLQRRLFGKTVLILGIGVIGADLATRCKALGMKVIGVTRTPRSLPDFDDIRPYEALADAAAEADFLVVTAAYSAETRGIVNARVLWAMKPEACLVNVGRGGICDEEALAQALREGRIAGAGLDAHATEPLPPGHPFWKDERVIVTPHVAGGSDFYPELVLPIVERNFRLFLQGRLQDMVNIVPRFP